MTMRSQSTVLHARCRLTSFCCGAVNKSPTTTLVLAMSAMAPDVIGNNNAYLYFFDGTIFDPSKSATPQTLAAGTFYPLSTQKYNTLADSWTSVRRVPTRRQSAVTGGAIPSAYGGAASVCTTIYAISSGVPSNAPGPARHTYCGAWGCGVNEAYDTVTDTWATKTPMPLSATRGTLVVAQGNRIFTFAANPPAYEGTFTTTVRNVNKYDATSDSWTSCARIPRRPWLLHRTVELGRVCIVRAHACACLQARTSRSGSSTARPLSLALSCIWWAEQRRRVGVGLWPQPAHLQHCTRTT